MPRYLISFDAHAMDHIRAEDMPAVASAAHEVVARPGRGELIGHVDLVVCARVLGLSSDDNTRPAARVAPGSHAHAKRDEPRRLATPANPRHYAETRMSRPPPNVHGKEGVDGSSPSEGFAEVPASGPVLLPVSATMERRDVNETSIAVVA